MGVLNKLYVLFPKRFWQNNYDWIGKISEKKGQWSEWVNLESALKNRYYWDLMQGNLEKK